MSTSNNINLKNNQKYKKFDSLTSFPVADYSEHSQECMLEAIQRKLNMYRVFSKIDNTSLRKELSPYWKMLSSPKIYPQTRNYLISNSRTKNSEQENFNQISNSSLINTNSSSIFRKEKFKPSASQSYYVIVNNPDIFGLKENTSKIRSNTEKILKYPTKIKKIQNIFLDDKDNRHKSVYNKLKTPFLLSSVKTVENNHKTRNTLQINRKKSIRKSITEAKGFEKCKPFKMKNSFDQLLEKFKSVTRLSEMVQFDKSSTSIFEDKYSKIKVFERSNEPYSTDTVDDEISEEELEFEYQNLLNLSKKIRKSFGIDVTNPKPQHSLPYKGLPKNLDKRVSRLKKKTLNTSVYSLINKQPFNDYNSFSEQNKTPRNRNVMTGATKTDKSSGDVGSIEDPGHPLEMHPSTMTTLMVLAADTDRNKSHELFDNLPVAILHSREPSKRESKTNSNYFKTSKARKKSQKKRI